MIKKGLTLSILPAFLLAANTALADTFQASTYLRSDVKSWIVFQNKGKKCGAVRHNDKNAKTYARYKTRSSLGRNKTEAIRWAHQFNAHEYQLEYVGRPMGLPTYDNVYGEDGKAIRKRVLDCTNSL